MYDRRGSGFNGWTVLFLLVAGCASFYVRYRYDRWLIETAAEALRR